jgi:hypothetical protein
VRSDAAETSDDILLEGFMKTEWSCPRIEQLGGLFSVKLLRQIGELTECNLTYNSESRMIAVVGPYQEACHAAILKLDKVRDYEASSPFIYQPPLAASNTPTGHSPQQPLPQPSPPLLRRRAYRLLPRTHSHLSHEHPIREHPPRHPSLPHYNL